MRISKKKNNNCIFISLEFNHAVIMKIICALLVLWVKMLFSSEVTADSFCHEVKKDNKDFLICDHVTPKNIFNGSKTIERYKYVKISNSSIIHIQLFRFKNIVFLQIINSLLEKIPYGGFSSSPNLEELHLELNEIEVIPYGAFPNFIETQSSTKQNYNTGTASKLKVLDLSSNSIHLIEDKSLTTESLRKLNLQRNRIKHIDGKFRYLTGKIFFISEFLFSCYRLKRVFLSLTIQRGFKKFTFHCSIFISLYFFLPRLL